MRRRGLVLVFCTLALGCVSLLACGGDDAETDVRTIVLITLDTLRRDHVSAYAPEAVSLPQPVTEDLDRLAAGSLRFDDARTPVPLTLPAHATMFSGLPPALTGVRLNTYGRLAGPGVRGFALLAERLRAAGWRTAAFVSADALHRRYGLDQGFQVYDDRMPTGEGRSAAQLAERPGAVTVGTALAHVRGVPAQARLFLWVHLFEPHAPYAADGTYGGDVEAGSRIVGSLLAGLAETGRTEAAAILFCSDHGEALGELGERTHGLLLADGVLRVPFLLQAPGLSPGVRTDPVDVADVAPTLAGLAGLDWPTRPGPGCGRDLLAAPAPAGRARIAESLYGHHLHRWAQLVAAVSPEGTLVDAGLERLHWIPPAPYQRGISSTGLVEDDARTRRLAGIIAEYRQLERPERMQGGQVAYGYAGGGVVEGFLPPQDNARLPDPHPPTVLRHYRIDQVKAAVLSPRSPPRALRAAVDALDALDVPELDAGSPELHFWRGQARLALAKVVPDEAQALRLLAEAEAAFLKAFELGRKDGQTLWLACGVNARGRERECLERLRALRPQVPHPGPDVDTLERRLEEALGR